MSFRAAIAAWMRTVSDAPSDAVLFCFVELCFGVAVPKTEARLCFEITNLKTTLSSCFSMVGRAVVVSMVKGVFHHG